MKQISKALLKRGQVMTSQSDHTHSVPSVDGSEDSVVIVSQQTKLSASVIRSTTATFLHAKQICIVVAITSHCISNLRYECYLVQLNYFHWVFLSEMDSYNTVNDGRGTHRLVLFDIVLKLIIIKWKTKNTTLSELLQK